MFVDGGLRDGRPLGVSEQEVSACRHATVDHPAFVVRRVQVVFGRVETGSSGIRVPDQPGPVAVRVFRAGVVGISGTTAADNLTHSFA